MQRTQCRHSGFELQHDWDVASDASSFDHAHPVDRGRHPVGDDEVIQERRRSRPPECSTSRVRSEDRGVDFILDASRGQIRRLHVEVPTQHVLVVLSSRPQPLAHRGQDLEVLPAWASSMAEVARDHQSRSVTWRLHHCRNRAPWAPNVRSVGREVKPDAIPRKHSDPT